MPNFAVRSNPSQISQTGTQDALIRNTGTAPVFLDAYSSVSPDNYGLELQPLDSVNWAEGRDLWAVTTPGDVGTLSVLYGAEGVSLGAVSAVVTGDVTATITGPVDAVISGTVPVDVQNAVINADVTGNIIVDSGEVNVGGILTPVVIQGGGQGVLTQGASLAAGASVNIPVTVPSASGSFYAFQIQLVVSGGAHATLPRIIRYTDNSGNSTNVVLPSLVDWAVGRSERHVFTVPCDSPSFDFTLTNVGAVTASYVVSVDGVNVAATIPTTNLGRLLYENDGPLQITPPPTTAIGNIYLPPSFQPYHLLMRANGGATKVVGMNLGYCAANGAFADWLVRAYNTGRNTMGIQLDGLTGTGDFGGYTSGAGMPWGNASTVYIPITGSGRVPRIQFPVAATNANSVHLMLAS
jgi:hypothetical protein